MRTSLRARRLRVTIKPGGIMDAIKPRNLPEREVERFLVQKSAWILDKIARLKDKKGLMSLRRRADYLRLRPAARELVLRKLGQFNEIYRVNFNRVAIRDQATRWGSCSRQGNLNFNYRIALLPERLADYVVAHEMCHLRQLNHSRDFWNLVSQAIPDYKAARKELRQMC